MLEPRSEVLAGGLAIVVDPPEIARHWVLTRIKPGMHDRQLLLTRSACWQLRKLLDCPKTGRTKRKNRRFNFFIFFKLLTKFDNFLVEKRKNIIIYSISFYY